MRLRAALAVVAVVFSGFVAVDAGSAGASGYNLSRLAVDEGSNGDVAGTVALLGYHVGCVGTPDGGPLSATSETDYASPPTVALLKGAQVYADKDIESLAACHPTAIFGEGFGPQNSLEASIAPVIPGATTTYQCPGPPSAPGPYDVCNEWKVILISVGASFGADGDQRAATVLANMDRRDAAIRGQVAGTKYTDVCLSPGSYAAENQAYPWTGAIKLDLGMVDIVPGEHSESEWDYSDEEIPKLAPAKLLIISCVQPGTPATNLFEDNSLYKALPAVKAGAITQAATYNYGYGQPDTSYLYTQIEAALKISEYHATLKRSSASTEASLTFRSSDRRLCWGISPPAGAKRPASRVVLKVTDGDKSVTMTSKSSKYVAPELDDPAGTGNNEWETSPPTYQTTGCVTLSPARASLWKAKRMQASLAFGGKTGSIIAGETNLGFTSGS